MFLGTFVHQIDDKGRIRIPPKFKRELGENPFVMQGANQCLYVYPMAYAEDMFDREFANGSFANEEENLKKSLIFGTAQLGEEDTQGRMTISNELLKYAGIEKGSTITTIGCLDHIQIWNKEIREDFCKSRNNNAGKELDAIKVKKE